MEATIEQILDTLKRVDTHGIAVLSTRHILDETRSVLMQVVEEIRTSKNGRSARGHTLERAAEITEDFLKEVRKAGGALEEKTVKEHLS